MTRLLAALALLLPLLACAAPQKGWKAEMVFALVYQCAQAGLGDLRQCACFSDALERISPDPNTKATADEASRAAKECGIDLKSKSEPVGEGVET